MAELKNTKSRILDLAKDLLQTLGFNAFSYHHISAALGVKNSAIHYHYPTKAVLGREVLERARLRARRWMEKVDELDDPAKKLSLFIEVYTVSLKNNDRICLVGSVSSDFLTIPEEMRQALRHMVDDIWAWLVKVLEEGRQKQVFHFPGEPLDKATAITSSLAGALQIARVMGHESYYNVVKQLKMEVGIRL